MLKLSDSIKATAYWSTKGKDYYFDRSAQAILNKNYKANRQKNATTTGCGSCSPCSCGIGGCGSGGGCDAY